MIFSVLLSFSNVFALFTLPEYYEPDLVLPSELIDEAFDKAVLVIHGKIKDANGLSNFDDEAVLVTKYLEIAEETKRQPTSSNKSAHLLKCLKVITIP